MKVCLFALLILNVSIQSVAVANDCSREFLRQVLEPSQRKVEFDGRKVKLNKKFELQIRGDQFSNQEDIEKVFAHFDRTSQPIHNVEARWKEGAGLDEINRAIANGKTVKEALAATPIARESAKRGFTEIKVRWFEGEQRQLTELNADFTKPFRSRRLSEIEDIQSASKFHYRDLSQPDFNFTGTVDSDATLNLSIHTRNDQGEVSQSIYASKMLDQMFDHFKQSGTPIRNIEGYWINGTNLEEYNRLIREGLKPEEAAKKTWTGSQAVARGFTEISEVKAIGNPGYQLNVKVTFKKPGEVPKPLIKFQVDEKNYKFFDPNVVKQVEGKRVPQFKFFARVNDEKRLQVDINFLDETGAQSQVLSASERFDQMIAHFRQSKTEYNAIEDTWQEKSVIEQLNSRIKNGESLETVLNSSWIAKQAKRNGYQKLHILEQNRADGKITSIKFSFEK